MDAQNATPRSGAGVPPKRPATKPVAPRLSSSVTRTTAASATRTSTGAATGTTTTPSSLTKPPTRPTTTSTARKPTAASTAATTAPGTIHRSRPSVTSVDASDSESKRDGITARPKRMSLASGTLATSTTTERPSTTASRTVTATPVRRTTAVSGTTTRPSVRSPTATSKSATVGHARTSSALSSRARPPSSASTRGVTTLADRKRLSTIPASPAVRSNKIEDEALEESGEGQVRPALGSRKSTRSNLIEQRIQEFELVNQMLQAAMTSDGMESEEQTAVNEAAKETIGKLRSDLAKLKFFEKEHGRVPTEEELAGMDDIDDDARPEKEESAAEVEAVSAQDKELAAVKAQLEAAQTEKSVLQIELDKATQAVEQYSKAADEASAKLEQNTQDIEIKHNEAIEKLRASHETKLQEMDLLREEGLVSLTAKHKSEIDALKAGGNEVASANLVELEALRAEVQSLKDTKDTLEAREGELEKTRDELKRKAKDVSQQREQLTTLKAELELLQGGSKASDSADDVAAAKDLEISSLKKEIEILAAKPSSTAGASKLDDASAAELAKTKKDLETIQAEFKMTESMLEATRAELEANKARHTEAKDDAKSKLAKAQEEHAAQLSELEEIHKTKLSELGVLSQTSANNEEKANAKLDDLEKAYQELQLTIQSRQDELATLEKTVAQLEQKLSKSEQARTDEAAAATATLSKVKDDNVKEVESVKSQLAAARLQLQQAIDTNDVQQSEVVKKANEELKAVRKELENAKTTHQSTVTDLERQIIEAKTALETAQSNEAEIRRLKEQVDADAKQQDDLRTLHIAELESVRAELSKRTNAVVATLKAEHAEEVAKQRKEAEASQLREVELLKTEHAEAIRPLEEQLKSALNDFEDLEASNTAITEKIRSEAADAQQLALEDQAKAHAGILKELETKLATRQNELAALKGTHEGSVTKLKSTHASEKDSALSELAAEHEKKINQLTMEYKSSQYTALEALKRAHMEEASRIESQLKAVSDEYEATKIQLQGLKDVLHSVDNETKIKDKKHEQALAQVQAELNQTLSKLSNQAAHMAELESQHGSSLQQAKEAVLKDKEDALAALKQDHVRSLESTRKELEDEHQNALDALVADHSKTLDSLKQDVSSRDTVLATQRAEHAQVLADMAASSKKGSEDVLAQLKLEHDKTVTDLMQSLQSQHEAAINGLKTGHATEIAKQARETTLVMDQTKKEHQSAIENLQTELKDLRVRATDTSQIDALNVQLNENKLSMERMQEAQAEMMSSITKEHEAEISQLNAQLSNLRSEAETPREDPERDTLNAQLIDAQRRHAELVTKHAQTIKVKDNEHQQALFKLSAEIEQLRKAPSTAPSGRATEDPERGGSLLVDARKTIAELSEQYANAALEAENQRVTAEKAQRELRELKQSLLQTEYKASNSLATKKIRTKDLLNGQDSKGKTSPKAGLGASKWAQSESEDTGSKTPPAATGNDVSESGVNSDGQSSTGPSTGVKRSAAGQMAGIQEALRELGETNNDLLEGHQRMAKTLNKVQSDGAMAARKDEAEEDDP